MLGTLKIHTITAPDASKRHLNAADNFRRGIALESDHAISQLNVSDIETHHAGHDYMSIVRNVRGDERQLLLGVADGHGDWGHYHSYVATRLLANMLLGFWPIYQIHLKNYLQADPTAPHKIKQLTEYCYQHVQDRMTSSSFPSIDIYSGTTMAMVLVIVVNGHRYLISTNAGDSQIIWADQDTPYKECSIDHNCDNIEAVRIYAERLANRRRQLRAEQEALDETETAKKAELQRLIGAHMPRDVYYNRINCGQVVWNMPEFLDPSGRPAPIPVFRYEGDDHDRVVLNQENYEKISRYYAHGTQSRRVPETYVREDGRTVAVTGKEQDNWGSTLLGESQTLHGLGDQKHYPHHSALPHVSVTPINQSGRLVLASDGATDLFYFQDLMQWFADHEKDPELVTRFREHLWTTVGDDPVYPTATYEGITYPRWDDVGALFVSLPDMIANNDALSKVGVQLIKDIHL